MHSALSWNWPDAGPLIGFRLFLPVHVYGLKEGDTFESDFKNLQEGQAIKKKENLYIHQIHTFITVKNVCMCVLSHVWLFVTLWAIALRAPLSLGFSQQEYWSALPFPSPEDLGNPGIGHLSPMSPTPAGKFFTTKPSGKINCLLHNLLIFVCMNVSLYISICLFTLDQKFPKNSALCSFTQPRKQFFGLSMSHNLGTQKQKFYHDVLTY